MSTYKVNQLKIHMTPKAETLLKFPSIAHVEFFFPKTIKTILFIHCTKLGYDEYEACGRLYATNNPKNTGENHIGELFIRFTGSSEGKEYETTIEILEWHSDGSFTIITEDGVRNHIKKSF